LEKHFSLERVTLESGKEGGEKDRHNGKKESRVFSFRALVALRDCKENYGQHALQTENFTEEIFGGKKEKEKKKKET